MAHEQEPSDTPDQASSDGYDALSGLNIVRRKLDAADEDLDFVFAPPAKRQSPGTTPPATSIAQPLSAPEARVSARAPAPTLEPARRRLLNVLPGEWGVFLGMAALSCITAITLEISYVLSVSGFLSQVGVAQTPLLWLVDMLIILLTSGVYTLIVDRVARQELVGWLVLGLMGIYLLFRLLFAYGAPNWLTYPGLFLLAEQQYTIFPLAFYALASDVYSIAQAKRLFPLIAGAGLIGQVIGNAVAGASAQLFAARGVSTVELLVVNALLLLVGFAVLRLALRGVSVESRQDAHPSDLREVVTTGLDFVRNVQAFRFLTIAMLCAGFTLTIIEFHFLLVSDHAFTDATSFQTFYGLYRIGLTLGTLAVQSLLTGWLLDRVGLKTSFLVLPVALLAAIGGMLAAPGIIGGAAGRFVGRLAVVSVDGPARQALQGLIPEERRGRVSAFMGSYLYAVGTIVGALLLAAALHWLAEPTAITLYLALGGVVGVGALAAAWRLRATYDESLLDWRLARRRRRSAALMEQTINLD